MPTALIIIWFAVFGLIFGSFANVLILRDDRRLTILTGRSACPHCSHELQWYELIPVFSFLAQAGRCRSCHKAISWQYPVLELVNAGLWALAAWLIPTVPFAAFLLAASFTALLVISMIDLRTQMVALEYCIAAAVLGGLARLLAGQLTIGQELIGLLVGGGSLLLVLLLWKFVTKQDGMGEGDIWIIAVLGVIAGWPDIIATLVASVLLGSVIGAIYALVTKQGLKIKIPFGPFLASGLLIALIWGQVILSWYILQIQ